jgi:acyl-CoA thioesterase FadM
MLIPIHQLPALKMAARPERLQLDSYPVQATFRIRWSDLENGRVSRVAVAHFFEDIRVVMMRQLLGTNQFGLETWKAVLRAVTIEHLAPATPDHPELVLAAGITSIGTSSYAFALGVFQQGRCIALGNAVGVNVDDNGRPLALDAEVRAILTRGLMPTVLETA